MSVTTTGVPYHEHMGDLEGTVLRCPYSKCNARVIKIKDNKTYTVKTGIEYLKVNENEDPKLNGVFIKVDDVWDFDNIGVSKKFEPSEENEKKLERLVICSECERGPLGFATFDGQETEDHQKLKYYLHLNSLLFQIQ